MSAIMLLTDSFLYIVVIANMEKLIINIKDVVSEWI